MTKQQAERYMRLCRTLDAQGFTSDEVDALLRASRVLSTWAERECNGEIQRDETTGKPSWYNTNTGDKIGRTSDREAGALNRVKAICARHGVTFYHQGDPRGCAVWIIRPGDVREGQDVGSCYTNGVAVCID
jgi:hypothetical protein